ncbi:uncharacterized oxidoreductase YjmC [Neodiprion virginianus]|uniref:uncharacterized oxidoreductase YjmC n=1 Tax=Neodiprion virginianus TaxID=2961670 RepID=UPI001EE7463C|nr:uncharacterized oxidoreductase YjmC [Neodiprion virginianus]
MKIGRTLLSKLSRRIDQVMDNLGRTVASQTSPTRENSSSATSSVLKEDEKTRTMVAPKEEVIRYIADSLMKVGASKEDAVTVGEHLFTADYRGHFSHGMNRMEMYVQDVVKKLTDPKAKPRIITDFKAVATVDGMNGFGQVTGKYCMELAMKKAKEYGIGMVACRGSNHYGIAGYYSLMAMSENLFGFSCTNTSPLMAPTRSRAAALGTNPISLGARGSTSNDDFVLDMATTCVALGKMELASRKGEPIPEGWALGADGKPTVDAAEAVRTACLMPLGGEERNSGYKGYGMALMVEVLCGILTGSKFGPNIRKWDSSSGDVVADLGHCFVAIDPDAFVPGSRDRLTDLVGLLRGLPTAGDMPVLIPGDPERGHMRKVDREGGITYHDNQIKASKLFAEKLGVQPMRLVEKTI